jgi:hypothetical protein
VLPEVQAPLGSRADRLAHVEGINLEQVDKWVADYGEDSDFVKVRVRGMFPSASPPAVHQREGRRRRLRARHPRGVVRVRAEDPHVDPGVGRRRRVRDRLRQGLMYRILRTIPKNDNDVAMANMIARLEDEEQADAVFVDGGYGTGIVSVGRTLGRDWLIVWFGGESSDRAA